MKIKTADLSGITLDLAVAWAKNTDYFYPDTGPAEPAYSTDWSEGGPIIEREGIDLYCNIPSSVADKVKNKGWATDWRAAYHRCGFGSDRYHGPTPLIAAMRCYVASKLGDEIEIPDELLEN